MLIKAGFEIRFHHRHPAYRYSISSVHQVCSIPLIPFHSIPFVHSSIQILLEPFHSVEGFPDSARRTFWEADIICGTDR